MKHVVHAGVELPVIGLGTWELRGDACVAAVRGALELGYPTVVAETRGIGALVTAYRPLMKGRVGKDPVLRDIAAAHDVTPEQVTLRWLIQQPGVVTIPKATSAAHQRENSRCSASSSTMRRWPQSSRWTAASA